MCGSEWCLQVIKCTMKLRHSIIIKPIGCDYIPALQILSMLYGDRQEKGKLLQFLCLFGLVLVFLCICCGCHYKGRWIY